MSDTLYERFNTGDDETYAAHSVWWFMQRFTIGNTGTDENHNITSVKILAYRSGSPGTVTVSIRATDGEGKPTDNDLTSGTLNGNDFTTDTAGLWYEFSLTPYGLSAGTQYTIVMRAPAGNAGNSAKWRRDDTSPTYTGGNMGYSGDSGSTWTIVATTSGMFEEYGIYAPPTGQFMQPTRYW